jgi:hypothetical protein
MSQTMSSFLDSYAPSTRHQLTYSHTVLPLYLSVSAANDAPVLFLPFPLPPDLSLV